MSKLIGEVSFEDFLSERTKYVWVCVDGHASAGLLRCCRTGSDVELLYADGTASITNFKKFRQRVYDCVDGGTLELHRIKCFDTHENMTLYRNLGEVYE